MGANNFLYPQLQKHLRKSIKHPPAVDLVAQNISNIIELGYFNKKPFKCKGIVNNNKFFDYSSIENKAILNICNLEIRKTLKIKQNDRNNIIQALFKLLDNQNPFVIYRYDIESFYESCNNIILKDLIYKEKLLCTTTKKMVMKFLSHCSKGLPRGLDISATLSEFYLIHLDREIQKFPTVLFYKRYVDDLIIVTTGEELKVESDYLRFQKSFSNLTDKFDSDTSQFIRLLKKNPDDFLSEIHTELSTIKQHVLKVSINKILKTTKKNDIKVNEIRKELLEQILNRPEYFGDSLS